MLMMAGPLLVAPRAMHVSESGQAIAARLTMSPGMVSVIQFVPPFAVPMMLGDPDGELTAWQTDVVGHATPTIVPVPLGDGLRSPVCAAIGCADDGSGCEWAESDCGAS